MPSLRQKVTTYFRQLSFIADSPRSSRKADDDSNFIIKYLEGRMDRIFSAAPEIYSGQNPTDLPDLKLGTYLIGQNTITAAITGPDEGLTGIKRSKLHLSASYADDIDFIDTIQESDCYEVRKSINTTNNRTHNKFGRYGSTNSRKMSGPNTSTSDQNANKVPSGMRSRKNSRTSISNLSQSGATNKDATKTAAVSHNKNDGSKKGDQNPNKSTTIVVSMVSTKSSSHNANDSTDQNNQNLLNAKTMTDQRDTNNKTHEISNKSTNGINCVDDTSCKLVEDTTESLLRKAVSNQDAVIADTIAGVSDWKMETDSAFGISVSLYENNMLTKEPIGNPIADCYGLVAREDAAVLALADGVNWGDGARLAARSAVQGCLDYLDRAIFGLAQECMATSTHEVFVSLLRSMWEGHGCILEVGGALSTLTIAVVLPLAKFQEQSLVESMADEHKYVVCACNVGDSLGYVYSKKHGVREITMASHDITNMRDMRDALGALGPADGNKPELGNLTLSMTLVEKGDIVFLTSDGISDNFDPVVGKFAEAWTADVKMMTSSQARGYGSVLAPKRQNKSASALYGRLHHNEVPNNPASPPVRPPRTKKSSSPTETVSTSLSAAPSRPKYMRSHTVIEPPRVSSAGPGRSHFMSPTASPKIPKSITGLPLVTGPQRHGLTLYRLENLLSYGINGTFSPCVSARRLCHLLIDFVRMITSARRKTLEQRELFYKLSTGPDGIKREVELNRMQHRAARKRIVDSSAFMALPGKLDHATVVAYTVGGSISNGTNSIRGGNNCMDDEKGPMSPHGTALQSKEFQETNF